MSKKSSKDRASLCVQTFADGRQCRMPWKDKVTRLCYFHLQQSKLMETAAEAGEFAASCLATDLVTNCSLNAALSRIFISVARGEYDLETARTLAYLAQVMTKSIPAAKHELNLSVGFDNMSSVVRYCLGRVNEHFRPPLRQSLPPDSRKPGEPKDDSSA